MKRPLWLGFTSPLLVVVAAACATPSQSAKQPAIAGVTADGEVVEVGANANTVLPKAGEQLICEYEETVGSHIPKKTCRRAADLERVREETQQAMRDYRPPATNNPSQALAPGN